MNWSVRIVIRHQYSIGHPPTQKFASDSLLATYYSSSERLLGFFRPCSSRTLLTSSGRVMRGMLRLLTVDLRAKRESAGPGVRGPANAEAPAASRIRVEAVETSFMVSTGPVPVADVFDEVSVFCANKILKETTMHRCMTL